MLHLSHKVTQVDWGTKLHIMVLTLNYMHVLWPMWHSKSFLQKKYGFTFLSFYLVSSIKCRDVASHKLIQVVDEIHLRSVINKNSYKCQGFGKILSYVAFFLNYILYDWVRHCIFYVLWRVGNAPAWVSKFHKSYILVYKKLCYYFQGSILNLTALTDLLSEIRIGPFVVR